MSYELLIVALVVVSVLLARALTGYGPITLLKSLWNSLVCFLRKMSGKRYSRNQRTFAQMSRREKKKSKAYWFRCFINEIILDMEWNTRGITVEGVTGVLQAISILCFFALFFSFSKGAIGAALLISGAVSFVLYVVLIAALYLMSRMNHSKRKIALMDAEDIICANMGNGVVEAVESSLGAFDITVRPIFACFLDEFYNRNIDIETAIDHLNDSCGEQFDSFCDKAKTFERERRPGMSQVFQYNISQNAFVRRLDRDCQKAFKAMNKNYWLSLSIIVGFLAYNFMSYSSMSEFYLSAPGKFLLTLYFTLASLCFVFIQYLQSKPFKFGSGLHTDFDDDTRDRYGAIDFERNTVKLTGLISPIDARVAQLQQFVQKKNGGNVK